MAKANTICVQCLTPIYKDPSVLRDNKHRCCSRMCANRQKHLEEDLNERLKKKIISLEGENRVLRLRETFRSNEKLNKQVVFLIKENQQLHKELGENKKLADKWTVYSTRLTKCQKRAMLRTVENSKN